MANVYETSFSYYYYLFLILLLCLIPTLLLIRSIFDVTATIDIHLPPSPPPLPILGHLHHLSSSALFKSLHHLATRYGPLLYLRLGASGLLLVSSASFAAEILKTRDLSFAARPQFTFSDKILYGNSGFINAPYGAYWRFMKKLCVTELLGRRQVVQSHSIRHQELHSLLQKLIKSAEKSEIVDVGAELVRLTNNVICRMAMSTKCSSAEKENEAEKVREMVKKSFELAGKLCAGDMLGPFRWLVLWLYGKKAADLTSKFDELLDRILKAHEEGRDRKKGGERDLMDILLEVYQDENAEVRISRANIKAFFIDLIVAGTDTSAQTMQWVLAELINCPDKLNKVKEEIERVVGTTRLVEESDIPNLTYLQAVIKETMRLHPSGPITTRFCRQSCKISGYDIPKNTPVGINLYTIMRDPNAWDDPEEFKPERFLGPSWNSHSFDDERFGRKDHSFDFIPFGAGRRGCPGEQLASALVISVIAAVIQCFDLQVAADGGKVDVQPGKGMSLGMANPLRCLPVVRFNPFKI